jgi:hypothetical protein
MHASIPCPPHRPSLHHSNVAWSDPNLRLFHSFRSKQKTIAFKIYLGEAEGKRWLGSPRRRWYDYIKMDVREIGSRDWIRLSRDHYLLLWRHRGYGKQLPLLLRVGPCLQSCCLATRWSNPVQYYSGSYGGRGTVWTGFMWLKTETSCGLLWYAHKSSGSVQRFKFLERLSKC